MKKSDYLKTLFFATSINKYIFCIGVTYGLVLVLWEVKYMLNMCSLVNYEKAIFYYLDNSDKSIFNTRVTFLNYL